MKILGRTVEMIESRTFKIIEEGKADNVGSFNYSREETKEHHKINMLYSGYGQKQLIGMESELTNKKLYTRIVNAYIKGVLK